MSDPRSPLVKPQRIDVVDWLRGVAVFLMILAHGMDAWLLPSAKSGAVYAVIRVASGIPARLFLLMVGISAAIQFESGLAKNGDSAVMRTRLLRRAFQVLLLAYLFRLQEWLLSRFYGGWESLLRVDILNAIALSMVVVALVATPRRGRRQIVPALALAALFLAFGSTVGPAHFPAWLPRPLTSYIGGQRPMAWFPLFPWGAWALTGVAVGHAWVLASRSETGLRSREKITCAKSAAEAPGWQGARSAHTRRYVSDERRSQPGCIGRAPAKVIFERRLSTGSDPACRVLRRARRGSRLGLGSRC